MIADLLVRYAHFMAIFVLFSLLLLQHSQLKNTLTADQIKRFRRLDIAYGITAFIVLLAGLSLWFWVGKPAGFYNHNWVFHLKITLFILTLALSVYPTLFLIKSGKQSAAVTVPKSVIMVIRMQLLLLCIIPLLAVLMANGVGYTR